MPRSSAHLWVVCAFLFSLASAADGQVVPAAEIHSSSGHTSLGAGLTSWDPDWGNGRMVGIAAWGDFCPALPSYLDGLGVELEARDVAWHRDNQPANYKQATIGAGPIYEWRRFEAIRPYGKFLIDYARMSYAVPRSSYSDAGVAYVPGVGLEGRAYRDLWVRLDYEYQVWQPTAVPGHRPTPQGFTLGVNWDFGHRGPH